LGTEDEAKAKTIFAKNKDYAIRQAEPDVVYRKNNLILEKVILDRALSKIATRKLAKTGKTIPSSLSAAK